MPIFLPLLFSFFFSALLLLSRSDFDVTQYDRYKDLAEVEKVFRGCKTVNLEVRPMYVRKEESTQGHVFVVMLAYLIIRRLRDAWVGFDLTVEGCLEQLATICSMESDS